MSEPDRTGPGAFLFNTLNLFLLVWSELFPLLGAAAEVRGHAHVYGSSRPDECFLFVLSGPSFSCCLLGALVQLLTFQFENNSETRATPNAPGRFLKQSSPFFSVSSLDLADRHLVSVKKISHVYLRLKNVSSFVSFSASLSVILCFHRSSHS